jgi:hypothetical protein
MPLANMVADGVNVLDDAPSSCAAAAWLRGHAQRLLDLGPPALAPAVLASRRYEITTLLEDLLDATAPDELLATAVKLYDALAGFALRAAGAWTGVGKHLVRRLRAADPALAADLVAAMGLLGAEPATAKALFDTAVQRTLAPYGGPLLEGFTAAAPGEWRSEGVAFP